MSFRFSPWGRYGVASIAGVCLALAFPRPGIAGLAWLAPALMLVPALGTRAWERWRIGCVAGLAHYLTSLSWLLHIPVTGYPILGWLALSAFLALFPAAWVWFVLEIRSPIAPKESPSWWWRASWMLTGAAAWVAMEMFLARVFGGFPWNFLGASQFQLLPLLQIAPVTGVYGVSFLVVWLSLALFCAAREIVRQPVNRYAWLGDIILPGMVLLLVFSTGLRTLRGTGDGARQLRVAFVQPSIPQTLIWDHNENTNRFRQLIELSTAALTNATDLLLWPEAAVPDLVRYDEPTRRAVVTLARSNRVWLIIGSDDAALRPNGTTEEDVEYFNAALLVNPEGEIAASYRKNQLVMFGEYIPLARWLPLVKWLTPISGGFTPGTKPVPFKLPELETATAALICYEDVFPHLVRRYVEADTDFLVNLTNDGWFGESAAQWQHAASAVFRAVENRRSLLRCCNNGLTCWVDECGRIRALLRDANGSIHGAGILHISLPMHDRAAARTTTFYTRRGDWFGWGCVALTAVRWAACCRRRTVEPRFSL